ncbi:MAG: hypothetical protein ABEI57_02745 [Halapricum sp.]
MQVRDAVEADAGRLAELTDAPRDVMRNLIHDRTVRVAEDDEEIVGFVSFDAREQTVHVTQIEGSVAACERLLDEPVGFASGEGMAVELLVPESNEQVSEAVLGAGFEREGTGPAFEGTPTIRYRLDPSQ